MAFYSDMITYLKTIAGAVSYGAVAQGNATITETGTAQQLPSLAAKELFIKADAANAATIHIGTALVSSSAHIASLTPGEAIKLNITNANLLYIVGTATDKVSLAALNDA